MVNCQGDYIKEVMNEGVSYPKKWDVDKTNANFMKWMNDKVENIMEFRNKTFVSAITDVESLVPKVKWFDNHETSVESFLSNGQEE
jgi:trimethylamine monooxygenase